MTPPKEPEPPPAPPQTSLGSPAPRSASLRQLLAENRARDPEFGAGLANHQSMALTALAALGGDEARLAAFASAYDERLRPLRAHAPFESVELTSAIGEPRALRELIVRFEAALASRGRAAVLTEVLPRLLPGLGGGSYHGLIRTAYALTAEEDAELAHALAYFVTVAAPLRALPPVSARATVSPSELLARAAADPELKRPFTEGLISDEMRAGAARPGFDEVVAGLRVEPETLDALALAALDLYLTTLDFSALHGVTSLHALRLLLPYVGDRELALRYHFQSLLAVALTVDAPVVLPPNPPPPPAWAILAEKAIASDDDHVVKMVFTCREEAAIRPAGAYQRAAALRLGIA